MNSALETCFDTETPLAFDRLVDKCAASLGVIWIAQAVIVHHRVRNGSAFLNAFVSLQLVY